MSVEDQLVARSHYNAAGIEIATADRYDPANPCIAYLATIRPASLRVVRLRLRMIVRAAGSSVEPEAFAWSDLEPAHVSILSNAIASAYAPETARACLVAFRGVLRACWRTGAYGWEHYERRSDAMVSIDGTRTARGRALSARECSTLFRAGSIRDRAMLALLFGAGLRRSEAAGLCWNAFDGSALRVVGKGDRERIVPLPAWAIGALRDLRAEHASGPILRRSQRPHDPLTPEGIYFALRSLASRTGVDACTPHDGRRTYVSELLDVTDAVTVSKLAGHSSPAITARYDRRADRAARDAVERWGSIVADRTTENQAK